jgi:small-conductance mechanosensitive channel
MEIIFGAFLLMAIVDVLIELYIYPIVKGSESKLDDQILYLAHKVSHVVFFVLALLYILVIWGVDPLPLVGSLGIAGLAVALALQPTLSNIFSGISLIVDKTFELGDIIKLDSGETGVVHRIGLRTTRIRTFSNEIIIIPNSTLANSKLENFYQPDRRVRIDIEFGVEYGVDPEFVKKITLNEVSKVKIRDQNEDVRIMFKAMGDSSLQFKVMFWVDDISKKWVAHQEAISRLYRRLYKEGIGIPFPQSTVWLREEGKAKGPKPSNKKFKSVKNKYYSNWGYEYKPEEAKKEPERKEAKKKGLFERMTSGFRKGDEFVPEEAPKEEPKKKRRSTKKKGKKKSKK